MPAGISNDPADLLNAAFSRSCARTGQERNTLILPRTFGHQPNSLLRFVLRGLARAKNLVWRKMSCVVIVFYNLRLVQSPF